MKKEVISDKELLTACVDGKDWGWEIFEDKFVRLIHYYITQTAKIHNISLNQEDLEDCYQSILLSIIKDDCKRLRTFRGEHGCTLASWIRIITVRLTQNFLQSLSKRQFRDISINEPAFLDKLISQEKDMDTFEDEYIKKETWKKIIDVIENKLSSREKLFSNLYWVDGLAFEEIAEIMNLSINNLYLIRHRIQKNIESKIERK